MVVTLLDFFVIENLLSRCHKLHHVLSHFLLSFICILKRYELLFSISYMVKGENLRGNYFQFSESKDCGKMYFVSRNNGQLSRNDLDCLHRIIKLLTTPPETIRHKILNCMPCKVFSIVPKFIVWCTVILTKTMQNF